MRYFKTYINPMMPCIVAAILTSSWRTTLSLECYAYTGVIGTASLWWHGLEDI